MALTANREVDHYIDQELRSFQVAAAAHVHKGALVGVNAAGYARPLVAGDTFVGLAYEEMDNAGGEDGAVALRVYTVGDFGASVAGATMADIGRPVFASDDEIFTFDGSGHTYLGVVADVVAAGEIILRIDPLRHQVKTVTHAVADLAAGADVSARAIHTFGGDAWIVGARVVNQETPAAGINDSNTCIVLVGVTAGTVANAPFNSSTPFPAVNSAFAFSALDNQHAPAGEVLTISVINGTTANPGPFLVEVDYV